VLLAAVGQLVGAEVVTLLSLLVRGGDVGLELRGGVDVGVEVAPLRLETFQLLPRIVEILQRLGDKVGLRLPSLLLGVPLRLQLLELLCDARHRPAGLPHRRPPGLQEPHHHHVTATSRPDRDRPTATGAPGGHAARLDR
jgi:hypothetical protein